MGLYDREYYREEHARREAWQIGSVTIALMAVTILVFLAQLVLLDYRQYGKWGDPLLFWGGFSVDKITDGQVWRIVTSLVLHHGYENIWLIVASLIVLGYCGRGVEGTYGPKEMFWFYLLSGLFTQLALLAVSAARPFNFVPPEPGYGCGGPVAAVMVLYALLAPNDRVPLFIGSIRASTLVSIVVLVNLGLFAISGGRYFAAVPVLAGAIFGLIYHRFGWRISVWVPDLPGLRRSRPRISQPRSRPLFRDVEIETPEPESHSSHDRPRKSESTAESPVLSALDEQLEAELDRVLGKVAKTGRESLTAEEHALLLRASEIYKMKRK